MGAAGAFMGALCECAGPWGLTSWATAEDRRAASRAASYNAMHTPCQLMQPCELLPAFTYITDKQAPCQPQHAREGL